MKQVKTIAERNAQLKKARIWIDEIRYPRRVVAALYKAEDIDKSNFSLTALRTRILTAQLLGWETEVVAGDDGSLSVHHVLRKTTPPPTL